MVETISGGASSNSSTNTMKVKIVIMITIGIKNFFLFMGILLRKVFKNFTTSEVALQMSLRVFLLCAAVVVFLFLKLSLRFDQVELNVYHSYVESFISDGDLNIADEMLPVYMAQNRIPIVTPRNNDPDFHSYGATVAWSPFWLMGRGFAPLLPLSAGEINHSKMELSNQQCWTHSSLSISTFLLGVLVIIGLAYFLRENQLHWSGALVCLGTPFYYYWINNPGNPSIFATFVALVVWGWLWNWKDGDGKNFFFSWSSYGTGSCN